MPKSFGKRALEIESIQWIISAIGAFYILVIKWTSSLELEIAPTDKPVIIALWHGRLALLHYLRANNSPIIALISPHRDGRLIRKCAWYFDIATVEGSASRRNVGAIRDLIAASRKGKSVFLTPDGPRGPGMQASAGVISLARIAALPIVPAAIGLSQGIKVRSWDSFLVPLPFSRIVVLWGDPIVVTQDANLDSTRLCLESELNRLQAAADLRARATRPTQFAK